MQRIKPILLAVPAALLALTATSLFSDEHDKKTDVTISEAVRIPGGIVLAPGKYMFILENSSDSRNIVEIKSDDGKKLYAMIFATRAARINRTDKTVLTFYEMPAGAPPALRQWYWPGDYDGQEFLYPHSEATKIDQATNQTVPEASDQEYAKLNNSNASTSDADSNSNGASAQSATAAPSSAAALNADNQSSSTNQSVASTKQTTTIYESTHQSVESQPAQSNASQRDQSVAQVNPPAEPAPPTQTLAQNNPPAAPPSNLTPPPSQDAASANTDRQSLPQTASPFPLAGMAGLFFLAAGTLLRFSNQKA